MSHIPVLLNEVLEYLNPSQGNKFIDGTVGSGGHTIEILKSNPSTKVLGIDLDQASLEKLREQLIQRSLSQRCTLVHGSYKDLDIFAEDNDFESVDGILLDVGYSSNQVDDPSRGFSFQTDGPLDMRFDKSSRKTAADVVNKYSEKELAEIIKEYGEDRFYRQIARSIVAARKISPIQTSAQLANLVPHPNGRRKLFQALRIEVNQELQNLEAALPKALNLLKKDGRLVVISFHSLEDRIVKNFFKSSGQKILTKKPIIATEEEINKNPRSKSAKLRSIQKI